MGSIAGAAPDGLLYQWQAYGVGSLTALCVTPGGELWTGSSRGNIRIWELQPKAAAAPGLPSPGGRVGRTHGEGTAARCC